MVEAVTDAMVYVPSLYEVPEIASVWPAAKPSEVKLPWFRVSVLPDAMQASVVWPLVTEAVVASTALTVTFVTLLTDEETWLELFRISVSPLAEMAEMV